MGREGFPGFGHGLGDGLALLGDGRQGFACLRPCGLHPVQLFRQPADFCFRVLHSSLGVVQVGLCLADSVGAVLHGFLQGLDLAFQLGDLGGGICSFFLIIGALRQEEAALFNGDFFLRFLHAGAGQPGKLRVDFVLVLLE